MTTNQIRIEIKKVMKSLCIKRADVYCRVGLAGHSIVIDVRAKNELVDMVAIESALKYLVSIDICESTGETLQGGNTFLCVQDIKGYLL